jgi:hypothetical protein
MEEKSLFFLVFWFWFWDVLVFGCFCFWVLVFVWSQVGSSQCWIQVSARLRPGDAIVCVGDTLTVRCRLVHVGRVRQEGVFVFFVFFCFLSVFLFSFKGVRCPLVSNPVIICVGDTVRCRLVHACLYNDGGYHSRLHGDVLNSRSLEFFFFCCLLFCVFSSSCCFAPSFLWPFAPVALI